MTVLLLTDMPPCSNYTAGIVTAQMCRAAAPDRVAVFSVLNPTLPAPQLYPDLAGLPQMTVAKPNEQGVRRWKRAPVGEPGAVAIEFAKRLLLVPKIARQAIAFGQAQGATSLWLVLEGQTMLRLALPVARGLGLPLRLHIWDPLGWWHKAHKVDGVNAWLDRRLFDRTLRSAAVVASASWAMTEHFASTYGVPGEPVIAALDRAMLRRPEPRPHHEGRLVIGMAGQFYAEQEWRTLVAGLAGAGWRLGGREVSLLTFGAGAPPGEIPEARLDHRGWQPQAEVVRALAEEADLLYCPYPFAQDMAEVARLSFPSKLPTFFAAGRPILFHGPGYSSPAGYIRRTEGTGLVVDEPGPGPVAAAIARVAEDPAVYARLAEGAQAAFLADFTLEAQRAAVRRFLDLPSATTGLATCAPA